MRKIAIPKALKFPSGRKVDCVKEMKFFNDNPVSFIKKYQLPWLCAEGFFVVDMIQTSKHNYILTLARPE